MNYRSLPTPDLLAILLGKRTASRLYHGSLHAVFAHENGEDAVHPKLQAAHELVKRWLEEPLRRHDVLTTPTVVKRYLAATFMGKQYEVFVVLFLDNRHRLIQAEEMFRGTIDGATVHPREIVRRALQLNAAATIVAHNHPSGVAEPSRADEALTKRIRDALNLVDVRLLDHFVVGNEEATSLAEQGLL